MVSCCCSCNIVGKCQLTNQSLPVVVAVPCCDCASTGKGQLSNRWLAVDVVVPLLGRVNSRTNGWLLLWLCHYWKGSTLEPMVSCCCGCAVAGNHEFQSGCTYDKASVTNPHYTFYRLAKRRSKIKTGKL
jgi:hypothetical protein